MTQQSVSPAANHCVGNPNTTFYSRPRGRRRETSEKPLETLGLSAHTQSPSALVGAAELAQGSGRVKARGYKSGADGGARKSDVGSPGKTQAKSVGFGVLLLL